MFSGIKMEEYMKPERSDIFWAKMVAKNILLGSPGTHFMNMRLNSITEINRLINKGMSNIYLKVTTEKNWHSQNFDFQSLRN